MEEQKNTPVDLQPGDMVITAGGQEYAKVADDEQLRFHISKVAQGEGKNYNTGEPEPRLVVSATLDEEGEGNGQVYSAWFKPSVNPKSNLAKFVKAVYGELVNPLDPTDLLGRPFRATLETKPNKEGIDRQYLNAFFKPASDQKRVELEVVPQDLDEETTYDDIPF